MGTRAVVGRYRDDGTWEGVWHAGDGGPDELGAKILRAAGRAPGGLAALADTFLAQPGGWKSWPDKPLVDAAVPEAAAGTPAGAPGALLTPGTLEGEFGFAYLFAVGEGRLDFFTERGLREGKDAVDSVRFDAEGRPERRYFMRARLREALFAQPPVEGLVASATTLEQVRGVLEKRVRDADVLASAIKAVPASLQLSAADRAELPPALSPSVVARYRDRCLRAFASPDGKAYRYVIHPWPLD
jgi:hypothetical protein